MRQGPPADDRLDGHEFGVSMFPTRYSIGPAELARAVEERGFESLFFPEHTHIPTSRRSPWPGGADLPDEYRETLDPFLALTAAAAATERILLGTGICLVVERDPITTAKEVATLDLLSGGRFLFGVGGGWNREEMENHGTDPTRRFAVLRERVLAMKEIWTNDEAEFHGELRRLRPDLAVAEARPAAPPAGARGRQRPGHARAGPGVRRRLDPHPRPGRRHPRRGHRPLREMAAERGRAAVPVTVFGARPRRPRSSPTTPPPGSTACCSACRRCDAAEAFKLLDTYANLAETERS